MNAKEAKQLTIQSKDIVGYVENEISEDYGYIPDMSAKMLKDCFTSLREV